MKKLFFYFFLFFIFGCVEKKPLPLLSERDSIECMIDDTYQSSFFYNGEQTYGFLPKNSDSYKSQCVNHKIEIYAFIKSKANGQYSLHLEDPEIFHRNYSSFFNVISVNQSKINVGDKVFVSGVVGGRTFSKGIAQIKNAKVTKTKILNEEFINRKLYKKENNHTAEEEITANRLKALIEQAEADVELANYAHTKRNELIKTAVRHKSINQGSVIIDSFELPNNKFVSCRLSTPGPIYQCDSL